MLFAIVCVDADLVVIMRDELTVALSAAARTIRAIGLEVHETTVARDNL
jgi:hypothetical protein